MECKNVREYFFDFESGQAPAAVEAHVRSCGACAAELASLRKTVALLDTWTVPEPSPYFSTRLHARLREEAKAPVSWWAILRRPAMALAFTLVVAFGVSIHSGRPLGTAPRPAAYAPRVAAQPGTAVGDLLALVKDHDLIANIELLDQVSQDDEDAVTP